MSKNEINELVQRFSAMTDDEISLMLTTVPSCLLFGELMRRDAQHTRTVNGLKQIMSQFGDDAK